MKKYELTTDTKIVLGKKVFRIKALVSFGNVRQGDMGGYVESEENLSNDTNDNAWVYGDAWVYDNAWVSDNARVSGDARVYGNAWVSGDADYTTIKGFGTEYRTTTFFRCSDGKIRVVCGCFYGTLDEFKAQVQNTRKGKVADEYLIIADLMEKHFERDK